MRRAEPPHASRGGSRGYDPDTRTNSLILKQNGLGHLATVSDTSMVRWATNGITRRVQTGGPVRSRLVGEHLFLLAVGRLLYPKAEADELIVFIAQNSANPVFYSRTEISAREADLGLTRKKASTTAFQAFTPYNIARRRVFWTHPFPAGIAGIPRQHLGDIDEAGLWLEKNNRKFGKAISGVRVRAPGIYGHGEKWTLIMYIECSGIRYYTLHKVAGTSVGSYLNFVRGVLGALPAPGAPNFQQRTVMHDNLSSHKDPSVTNAFIAAGHRSILRSPYRPVDGPIEYVLNQLQRELTHRINEITDDASFVRVMASIITNLSGFDAAFLHCGYT